MTIHGSRGGLGFNLVHAQGRPAAKAARSPCPRGRRAGVFSPAVSSGSGGQGAPAAATAAVTRQDIAATTPETATLGYAGSYTVTGRGGGTLTWLPSAGQVIRQGHALYRTGNGPPVVLLYGSVPDWRSLDEGVTGQDVSQLNHDLVDLGYVSRADIVALGWDYFSSETAAGVGKLQSALGVSPSGSLPLGQVVFEPQAARPPRRYRGTRKNLFDLRRVAVIHNLHVLARSASADDYQLAALRLLDRRFRSGLSLGVGMPRKRRPII